MVAELEVIPEALILETTGDALSTVTLTAADVAVFPAASRATAVKVWDPLTASVVFHEREYGAAVTSAPRFAPSSLNCTPTTPTLSVALAETITVPAIVNGTAWCSIRTVGGVVAGGARVVK